MLAREAGDTAVRRADEPDAVRAARLARVATDAAVRRANEPDDVRAARLARDAARHAAARAAANDGPYFLAAPENMPSDAYLNTHERNPTAMVVSHFASPALTCSFTRYRPSSGLLIQAHFWVRTGNWRFTLPAAGRGAVLQRAGVVDQGRDGINVANAVDAIAPGAPAAAVHATIGLWRPLQIVNPAPLSHVHAAYARSLRRGPLTAHGGGVQHSSFFVPFLRAAQGLDDPLIPFLRNTFIGAANWDAAVTRTAAVFTAAGVTPAFTRWNQGGYLGEFGQIALLRLENRLLLHWPAEAPLAGAAPAITPMTGGELIMQLVGMRLAEAGHVLGGPALPPLPPQFGQHVLRTTPPTPSSTPTPSLDAVLDPDAAAMQVLLDRAAAAAVQLNHAAAAAQVLLHHFAAAAQLLREYAAAVAEVLLDYAAVAVQMGTDRYDGTRVYDLWRPAVPSLISLRRRITQRPSHADCQRWGFCSAATITVSSALRSLKQPQRLTAHLAFRARSLRMPRSPAKPPPRPFHRSPAPLISGRKTPLARSSHCSCQ